jgi:hypothetical protein
MPNRNKLIKELQEVRQQAQAIVDRIAALLDVQESPQETSRVRGNATPLNENKFDFIEAALRASGKPMTDSEIISTILPKVIATGVEHPDIQAWKSIQFHVIRSGALGAVIQVGDKYKECELKDRTDTDARRRTFPGNLIALREWISGE